MSKEISTRIKQKHDFEVNWLKATNFKPLSGELIIYDAEVDSQGVEFTGIRDSEGKLPHNRTQAIPYPRFKVGDGNTFVSDLPFSSYSDISEIEKSTDTSIAYTKDVPSDALSYAQISKIGGMTKKCKNLFDPSKLLTADGWTVDANGVYSGRSGALTNAFTQSNPYMTFNNVDSLTLSFYGRFEEGQTPAGLYFQFKFDDGTIKSFGIQSSTDTYYTHTVQKAGAKIVSLFFSYGNGYGIHYLRNIQIETGTTATDYEPYYEGLRSAKVTEIKSVGANLFNTTYAIPEAVQALDGYGSGINADCYNYVDWEKKQFVKRVSSTVLNGSENWMVWGSGIVTDHFDKTAMKNTASVSDCEYEVVIGAGSMMTVVRTNGAFTVEEWKAYLAENPVTVVYQLATPIVTDISDILSINNVINVEGGGTVTTINEHNYAVPSEITYYISENAAEIIGAKIIVGDLIGTAQCSTIKVGETILTEDILKKLIESSNLLNAEEVSF